MASVLPVDNSMHAGVSTLLPVPAVQDSTDRLMIDHCEPSMCELGVTGVETYLCVLQERGASSGHDASYVSGVEQDKLCYGVPEARQVLSLNSENVKGGGSNRSEFSSQSLKTFKNNETLVKEKPQNWRQKLQQFRAIQSDHMLENNT